LVLGTRPPVQFFSSENTYDGSPNPSPAICMRFRWVRRPIVQDCFGTFFDKAWSSSSLYFGRANCRTFSGALLWAFIPALSQDDVDFKWNERRVNAP